jgi:signal transduction histidine kinase
MQDRQYPTHTVLSTLLDTCADELEALVAEETGEGPLIEHLRRRIDELFGPRERPRTEIDLTSHVQARLEAMKPRFAHRAVQMHTRLDAAPPICLPVDVAQKIVDGVVKNAIENTPDEGKITVEVGPRGKGVRFVVRDEGVGITEENQRRIFEGFFTTHETMAYSSKNPFDFNAGGRGADLLRMKIFSERYGFTIDVASSRCRFIPTDADVCPGRISECPHCNSEEDCARSGGTTFTFYFPPAPESGCNPEAL